jgi:hypothetical protein
MNDLFWEGFLWGIIATFASAFIIAIIVAAFLFRGDDDEEEGK